MTARALIDLLALQPHPEGGWYRQTFADAVAGGRDRSTAIYYLLEAHQSSAWHRIDAAEVWHWYAGAPLLLTLGGDGPRPDRQAPIELLLGNDLVAGQRPQGIVAAGNWQAARSLGDWTLVGCTVAPGFSFAGFEMEPPQPPGSG